MIAIAIALGVTVICGVTMLMLYACLGLRAAWRALMGRVEQSDKRLDRAEEVTQARERYLADLFAAQNRLLIETTQGLIDRNQDTMAKTVEKVLTEQRFAIQRMFPEFARPILSEEDQKTMQEMQTGDLWRDKREAMTVEELEAHYASQGNLTG